MAGSDKFGDGVRVIITDVRGTAHEAVARSEVEGRHKDGKLIHDFPVVWVDVARSDGQGTARVPWPLTDVRRAG